MKKEKQKTARMSILLQVALIFVIGMLTSGTLTFLSKRSVSESSVKGQIEKVALAVAEEVQYSVREFPAYQWLLRYWYDNWETMDIEYDAVLDSGTETEKKARLLMSRHPGLQLRYMETENVIPLPEEDQKLFAEISYSWLITRINEIKRSYHVAYLFAVIPEDDFKTQFFLFSAADEGAERGTVYEQVYPIGTRAEAAADVQEAMKIASRSVGHLADAGKYIDYYASMGRIGSAPLLIGLTYDLEEVMTNIRIDTRLGTAYAVLHQLILSLLVVGLLYYFVLRPLKKVQENIRLYRDTKDSETVRKNLAEIRTLNEIDRLSEDVSSMASEIDDHMSRIQNITAEQERLSAELGLAHRIQSSALPNIFPPFPDRKEIDIFASMDPAKEVGGDFYDFFLVDEDHFALVIADVSGKGVPASLFMMITMILIHNAVETVSSPAEALQRVNERICRKNPEEMFITVWLGILDLKTGKMIAANAGHEYPVICQPGGAFELVKDRHGFVIGGMAGIRYKEYELQLAPGSRFFVYTDGLPEATDTEKQLFGTDRMLEALNAKENRTPEEILSDMNDAVNAFIGDAEQFDDLTMLCIRYNGPEAG